MSNAPSKPVSFSRPKVGYFSNRPRIQQSATAAYNCSSLQQFQVSGTLQNQNIKMVKKLFLNSKTVIPTAQVSSVSREESDLEVASSSRKNVGSE